MKIKDIQEQIVEEFEIFDTWMDKYEYLIELGKSVPVIDEKNKTSVISFNIGDIHPYDIGSLIDNLGIAVRTGHHCAQPIMDYFKIPGTIRVSFCFYNTTDEIDSLISALKKASKMLS